ncbi:MAG: zinc dependent phospholipase C family protein [Roseateles sp.]|uniref:zinc dependent phospholipase C family protein n=1 Tax=Roseateles sp. TaxID=1971397 RepID=UPI0039ECC8D3
MTSKLLAIGLALLLPLSGHAFKLNTHIWIGQQVINDLEATNGKITIRLNGQIVQLPVRDDIRLAILQNKNDYLLGNIGPDAMPDVVVGQMLLHPGQADAWKASDWMQHLLQNSTNNPQAKAFAYGYLGHASADVFAHTYVNQYAGDIFSLADETLVEERHVALEGFIAKYTPPLTSSAGAPLGSPWTVVRPSDGVANFLRDQLIYSSQAQAQYLKAPYAAHLVAFKEYRTAIDAIAEDGVWRDIDIAVAKFISTQFGYNLSTAQAAQAVDMIAKVNDKLNRSINVTQAELSSLHNALNTLDLRMAQGAKAAADRALSLEAGLISAQNDLEALLVEKTCDQVDKVCPGIDVPDGISCRWYGCWPKTKRIVDPVCKATFERTCKDLTTILTLRNQATVRLLDNRKKVNDELLAAYTELSRARESAVALANAMIDFTQIPSQGSSPIQAILRNWRADTDQAVADYVKAASQAMINTMDPAASAFTPLQRWLDCSYPSLVGMSAVVSNCGVRDSATQIVRSLDRLANLPTNAVAASIGLPTTVQLAAL